MSRVIQIQGVASGLFSSSLFCLWLSTASLVVWVDFGRPPAEHLSAGSQAAGSQAERSQQAAPTDAIKHD